MRNRPAEPARLAVAVDEVRSLARENVTAIIWPTGYAYDYGWVKIPVFNDRGQPV
jgi:putative flavoprotein involved in K+ transport